MGETDTIPPITERFSGAVLQGEEEFEQSLASQERLSGWEAALPSDRGLPLVRGPLGMALGQMLYLEKFLVIL